MSGLALVGHQFRFDQRAFWRNPASVFFTVMFPVLLLVIFGSIFGSSTVELRGGHIDTDTYYVPAIISMAIISSTMQSLAMSLVIAREDGRLKRGRGTPMPPWVFIAGRVGNSIVTAVIMLALLSLIGGVFYGVHFPWDRIPALLLVLAIGAASFSCLGIALTAAVPTQDAAAPIVNFLLLPLYFLSGVFIPDDQLPSGIIHFADIFPIRHFFLAFFEAFVPGGGSAVAWDHLLIVAIWGVGGLLLAVRFFRWTPARAEARSAPPAASIASLRQMLHHVLLEVEDLETSASFYDTMLAPLGWRRHFDEDKTIGWGIAKPVFFISAHHDPHPGYGLLSVSGLGIVAVKAAYENGIRAGGTSVAEPGERRSYGSGSYSAFLKDPDGYEIEITVGSD